MTDSHLVYSTSTGRIDQPKPEKELDLSFSKMGLFVLSVKQKAVKVKA